MGLRWVLSRQVKFNFWKYLYFSLFNRSTAEAVEAAGFTNVDQKKYDFEISREDVSIRFKVVRTFVKRHVMGVATK